MGLNTTRLLNKVRVQAIFGKSQENFIKAFDAKEKSNVHCADNYGISGQVDSAHGSTSSPRTESTPYRSW
jgi:hypothetical protein